MRSCTSLLILSLFQYSFGANTTTKNNTEITNTVDPSSFFQNWFGANTSVKNITELTLEISTKVDPLQELCNEKICIRKCCPENQHVVFKKRKCVPYENVTLNITLPVYDEKIEETNKHFDDIFYLIPAAFKKKDFRINAYVANQYGFNVYLTEDGTMYLECPNAFIRWMPKTPDQFCLDYHYVIQDDNTTRPSVGVWASFVGDDDSEQGNKYFTIGMIISCVFLVVVLVVYLLLPELMNLCGQILMAYTVSLFFAFVFLMVVQRGGHSAEGCIGLTLTVYFFFLASFCWMNIMSYDIWWTFRGYAKARPIHRRGEKFKFAMYCLYAWGVPTAMTTALAVFNHVDMKSWPWFITPKIPDKGCFLEGGEKLVYLYSPMLIMIVLNWMFFLMTAFNIWRLSRGTAVLDSAAAGSPASHRKQRHRLLVYLKLSILMGLNWILEVASSFKPQLKIWYIFDAYNLLIGLSIFLIFVCKKKIFKKLNARLFSRVERKGWNLSIKSRSRSRSSSVTETSNISQDAPVIHINSNPKGPKQFF